MKKLAITILTLLISSCLFGQGSRFIYGGVYDENKNPLKGAIISSPGGDVICTTNEYGQFQGRPKSNITTIIVSLDGFNTKTVKLKGTFENIKLSRIIDKQPQAKQEHHKEIAPQQPRRTTPPTKPTQAEPKSRNVERHRNGKFFASLQMAMPGKYVAFGAMTGWVKNGGMGGYIRGAFRQGDFYNRIWGYDLTDQYLTGETVSSYDTIAGGVVMPINSSLYWYGGLGATSREVAYISAWDSSILLASREESFTSLCIDAGVMLKIGTLNVSAGTTYAFKRAFVGNLGVGFYF